MMTMTTTTTAVATGADGEKKTQNQHIEVASNPIQSLRLHRRLYSILSPDILYYANVWRNILLSLCLSRISPTYLSIFLRSKNEQWTHCGIIKQNAEKPKSKVDRVEMNSIHITQLNRTKPKQIFKTNRAAEKCNNTHRDTHTERARLYNVMYEL